MLQCNWVNKPRGPSTKTRLAFNLYWFPLSVWGVVIYNCLILFTIMVKTSKEAASSSISDSGNLPITLILAGFSKSQGISCEIHAPLVTMCWQGFHQKDTCSLKSVAVSSCLKMCPWYKVLNICIIFYLACIDMEKHVLIIKNSIFYNSLYKQLNPTTSILLNTSLFKWCKTSCNSTLRSIL